MSPTKKEKDSPFSLTPMQERVLEGIGQRVANSPIVMQVGQPKTDGHVICLPLTDKTFTYADQEGMMAHEGGHIRFKSIIGVEVAKNVCPENPKLGQLAVNIFEDARVNLLIRQTYPGLYDELMVVNDRFTKERIAKMAAYPPKIVDDMEKVSDLLINMAIIYDIDGSFIWNEAFRVKADGTFKYASPRMGRYWDRLRAAFDTLYAYMSFNATIIASRMWIDAIREYLQKPLDDETTEDGDCKIDGDKPSKKSGKDGKPSDKDGDEGDGDADGDSEGEAKGKSKGKGKPSKDGKPTDGKGDKKPDDAAKDKKTLDTVKTTEFEDEKTSSGISAKDLSKEERDRLEKVTKELGSKEDLDNPTAILEKVKDVLSADKKDMESLVEKIKTDTYIPYKTPKCDSADMLYEDREKIELDVLTKTEEIQSVNHIRAGSGTELYKEIVSRNNGLIYQLRTRFNKIRQQVQMERGARRGIISRRDLPIVVASHGRNNRPFMSPLKSTGAYLIIVVDESGSMEHSGINIAREAAVVMAEALKDTRIKYSVIGFGAVGGSLRLCEKVYKAIDEPVNPEKLGAIWTSGRYVENRDGSSFRGIKKHHLKGMQGGIPLMIIISDGRPCHGGTDYTGDKGMADTAKAVKEIKQEGVAMFALSIDSSGDSYLKDIYGSQNYFVVSSLEEVQNRLIGLVEGLVRSIH